MPRTPFLSAVLVLLALTALAAAPGALAQSRPPLEARLAACSSGPSQDDRFAVFTASMPAYAGTARMAMRFDLYTRPDATHGAWERVHARGFGWQRSAPGRAGFVYTKRVERLRQAALYRVVVRFRWFAADGSVQRTAVRRTPVCREPDQRPDLRVESLTVGPGPDDTTQRYVISLLNTGRTAAGPFDVGLTTGGADAVRAVPGLAAGERTSVEIVAPRCQDAAQIVARADVKGVVDESDEHDNRFIRLCSGR